MSAIHTPTSFGTRFLVAFCAAIALVAAALVLDGPRTVSAGHPAECEVIDLGELTSDAALQAQGRWTTEDCDSHFRIDSDAHTYRFQLAEGGRIRFDLTSDDADSYLYLLAEDGSRITDNDDGGAGLNARIERDMAAGVYLVEATTVGGRGRGPADFTLSVTHVTGCEPVHLGTLEPGVDLTASGSWTIDTCGARVVAEHPAYAYSFSLPRAGRVLIDLISVDGDPVLSLASSDGRFIGANDDGGGVRNSRIEQYLAAGIYLIEATTYLQRDLQPLTADFDLVVHLVDEEAEQRRFKLKIEATHAPDRVVAGEPFDVHYRAGNPGGGDLADGGGRVVLYVVAPRVFERIVATPEQWQAGVAYHSGAQIASATSVAAAEVTPFAVTLNAPGPSWVFVAIIAFDEAGDEIAFHGIWRNLVVLSNAVFDSVTVQTDGADYAVEATAGADGSVTISVSAVADPDAEVDPSQRAKAIYAAGVQALLLDGILERPAIAALADQPTAQPTAPDATSLALANPSSTTLLDGFGWHYADALADSGLADAATAGNVITPAAVEDLTLAVADDRLAHFAPMAASWTALLERIEGGAALTFEEAFAVQSQLAYAEAVASPAVAAGQAVQAAREAEAGWADPAVRAMLGGLAAQARCDGSPTLGDALLAIGVENIGATVALDAELRGASPAYGLATDAALCAIGAIDGANSAFLESLGIARSDVAALVAPEPPPAVEPEPEPVQLRVIARLAEDGRIEHGVELASGEQVLPQRRFLDAEPDDRRWFESSNVEVDGGSIGIIRARRLDDGRVEFGFVDADGNVIAPDVRFLPAELAEGVWLRSSEFEAPPPAPAEAPDEAVDDSTGE